MSKTLLLIHSYERANPIVKRHWPLWECAECDIMGVGRENSHCWWPEGIPSVDIGLDSYINGDNLCRRLIDTFRFCVEHESPYTDFCVIEYDCITLDKLPPHPGEMLWTCHAVGGMPGFKAQQGFHCPWWADRATAKQIVECGDIMLGQGDIEKGTPDLFLGWLVERFGIRWSGMGNLAFSRNTIDNPSYLELARDHVKNGALFIHGIKTERQLQQVIS